MLTAINELGKEVLLPTKTRTEIELLRKDSFYCPVCKERVIVKAGDKVIPHFAHRIRNHCHFMHRESEYHEKGKFDLYKWAKQQGLKAKVEVYFKKIQQRADVLVKWRNRYFALEFQCATISSEMLQKRTMNYKKIGIIPIWILGAKQIKRMHNQYWQLKGSLFPYFHQWGEGYPVLYSYDPNSTCFTILSNPYPNHSKVYGNINKRLLWHIPFEALFQPLNIGKKKLYNSWLKEKRLFRCFRTEYISKEDRFYLNWLYSQGLHPQYLPAVIHLPLPHHFVFQTNPYIWQSAVILKHIVPLKIGDTISHRTLASVQSEVYLRKNSYGVEMKGDPIGEYIQMLVKLGILKKINLEMYMKKKDLYFPKTLDEANLQDTFIMKHLMDKIV